MQVDVIVDAAQLDKPGAEFLISCVMHLNIQQKISVEILAFSLGEPPNIVLTTKLIVGELPIGV